MRRLDQPNFSLCSLAALSLFLGACWLAGWLALPCLALPKQPGHRTLGQITAAMNGSTALASTAGMIDAVRRDWTARRNRGVLSRFCACHVCLVCGLWMRSVSVVRALEAVALAQVEANPQRLLRFPSHSPFLPTFFHFAVRLDALQFAFASTSPFSPSPPPFNRLISGIPRTLDTIPTSDSPSATACKQ